MADIKYNSVYKFLGIIAYYLRYKYTQYWSQERVDKYQFVRLKKMLIQANKTVYYAKLFKEIGFNPFEDFKSLNDLIKIPITSKSNVKLNTEDFVVENLKKKALLFYTSGSTGNPMKAYIHPLHWIIEQAVIYRHWKWGGYNFWDSTAMIRSYSPRKGEPLTKYSKLLNTTYFSPFHLSEKHMLEYYDKMKELKVVILRGYPSSIKAFVVFLSKNNLKLVGVKQVLTASEVLTSEDRSFIEEVLECKVSNHYGLAEQIVLMGDCENHSHLHNYFEYGFIELLDTDQPNIKRIIGTNLHNKTMPILRYDTGDLALIDNSKCKCRRNGISIKNIIGRNDQSIKTPNGYEIPSVNFYTMFEHYLEINQWQITYDNININFNYSSNENLKDQELDQLRAKIESRINNSGFKYQIRKVSKFHQKSGGKTPTIIKI